MTRPVDLRRARDVLTRLAIEYPEMRVFADRLLATQPWPADVMAGGVSGGDISDPTGNNAVQDWLVAIDNADDAARLIVKLVDGLDNLCREVRSVVVPVNMVDHRCNGGEGMKGAAGWKGNVGWGRPDCTKYIGNGSTICDSCRQRRDYHMRNWGATRNPEGEWVLPR